jgi:branched-chain amino acid transport system substrate-binding protein
MIFMIAGSATDELLKGRVDKNRDRYKYLFRVTPVRSTDLAKLSIILLSDVIAKVRSEFGIAKPKVAILAEKLTWNEKLIGAVKQTVTAAPPNGLGCELVGTFQPSATASDVTSELNAIAKAKAHVIYTANSGPVGIPVGRDYGRLKIPAAMVGITVEAQDAEWPTKTGGLGDYVATLQTYAPVKMTDKTISFYNAYKARFGKPPAYTAGTYEGVYVLKEAIERAQSLNTDAVVTALEKTDFVGAAGRITFDELHDIKWGPGLVTALGIQWQSGKMEAFWPLQWKPDAKNAPNLVVGYEGVVPFKFPPWMVDALK